MSKPVFEDLFRFGGRRNRQSFILLWLAQLAAWMMLAMIGAMAVAAGEGNEAVVAGVLLAAAMPGLALMVSGWAVAGQRCRDFGWTGWSLLIMLVPYVGWVFGFALWFVPGTLGENRYGPDPLDTRIRATRQDALLAGM